MIRRWGRTIPTWRMLSQRRALSDQSHGWRGERYTETTTSYRADADGRRRTIRPSPRWSRRSAMGIPVARPRARTIPTTAYGNVTQEVQRGDTSTTTDDRTVVRTYSRNTTKWIVSPPHAGAPPCRAEGHGHHAAQTDFYYDGTTSCTVASTTQHPTHGNLTRIVRWRSGAPTSPETRMAYDAKGNRICSRGCQRPHHHPGLRPLGHLCDDEDESQTPSHHDCLLWGERGRHDPAASMGGSRA